MRSVLAKVGTGSTSEGVLPWHRRITGCGQDLSDGDSSGSGRNVTVVRCAALSLWHMVAALAGALLLDAVGLLPASDVHSGAWWLGRVPWIAALTAVLVAFVAMFGRIETRTLARKLDTATARATSVPDADGTIGHSPRRGALTSTLPAVLSSIPVVTGAYVAAILGHVLAGVGRTGTARPVHGPDRGWSLPARRVCWRRCAPPDTCVQSRTRPLEQGGLVRALTAGNRTP